MIDLFSGRMSGRWSLELSRVGRRGPSKRNTKGKVEIWKVITTKEQIKMVLMGNGILGKKRVLDQDSRELCDSVFNV